MPILRPMLRAFRPAALLVALTAMLLGAMLPTGWMPDANGMPVMCSLQDHHNSAPDRPADSGHNHECPFAAAPHLAPPLALASLAVPNLSALVPVSSAAPRRAVTRPAHAPQAPRAPPLAV